ncbi:uncharacterized protein EAE97_002245 [Botrytis byssoidea]|uniref:Uncharacterized protein n=1 Tax=Botrytis byssoidea TaxID=139641 RepID=A0A9P5IQR5_9HELO|nr:uncharacterized protein EAE97_002245 [Botrytis byssoidea]KAF7950693.1 hypothetical protein EAE97_002245 [Botrytis byssoidea]
MGHILIYHTHGSTRTLTPTISNPSNPSNPSPPPTPSVSPQTTTPRVYGAYAARYSHIYPSRCKIHVGTLSPLSRHPVTPMRAALSSILLAQRSALARIETIKATNCDPDACYLPIHEDPKFRAELNEGVGFDLDIYSSSKEVISLIQRWPFDDAMKGMIPGKRLPYVDLILEFDQLNKKLHKLGQASLGYHVKYHYIPMIDNRAVEVQVIAELDRYAAKLEKNLKEREREISRGEETELESEVEEPSELETTLMSKPWGTSIQAPESTKMKRKLKEKGMATGDETETDEEMEELLTPKITPISKLWETSTNPPKSAKTKRNLKEKKKDITTGDETETDEEMQELFMPKTTPVSKSGGRSKSTPKSISGGRSFPTPQSTSGGKSFATPQSTSGGKSFPTPQSTPVQKPKPKLKLISRDPRVRGNSTPKPPES